jgi:hypothetical protein
MIKGISTSEDGDLKVSEGSLIIMKGELKSPNLYLLHGTTVFYFII